MNEPIARPVITTIVKEKQRIDANNLPYLHRNPAIWQKTILIVIDRILVWIHIYNFKKFFIKIYSISLWPVFLCL